MYKQKYLLIFNLVLLLVVFEAHASKIPTSALEECGSSELQCSNGRCIESRSRCDQKLDCPDGSDEVGCDQQQQCYPSLIRPARAVNSTSNDTTQIVPSPTQTKRVRNRKIPHKTSNETTNVFDETLNVLEDGDRQIELRLDNRDLVLVTGLPGAGKTTITKFITNPNELEAYQNGGRILIRDRVNNNTNATSKVVSKTIFPQLMIHGPSNTSFYDLPGFSDNQKPTITKAILKSLKEQTQSLMSTATANATINTSESNNSLPHQMLDTKTLFEHLTEDFNSINRMLSQLLTASNFAQFSNIILNGLQNTHLKIPSSISASLRGIAMDMNFNSGINGECFPFKVDIWVKPIELSSMFLQNQIQLLSFNFSEEKRWENEARMNEQLETLRNETKQAAEKAIEEREQLALECQLESGNGQHLKQELTKVQDERERQKLMRQLGLLNTLMRRECESEREQLRNQVAQLQWEVRKYKLMELRLEREKEQQELKTKSTQCHCSQ